MERKRWTLEPPCDAELLLDKLFSEKKISPSDNCLDIQKKYDVFKGYSVAVFRNNFKRHRDREGFDLCKFK